MLARAEFGWNTTITAGRWCPLRVWLDGSLDGAAPVSGLIQVSFAQDRTQNVAIVVPASTTPGKLTPVDLAVCIPADVGTVTVSFITSKRDYTLEFTPPPTSGQTATPTRGEQRLGLLFGGTRGLVVHAGIGSIDRSFPKPREVDRAPSVGGQIVETYLAASGGELAELRWRQLAVTDMALEELPPIPHAYDGLEALVIDPAKSAGIDPRVRAAIMEWTAAGGRLILLATDESSAWRQWLPPAGAGEWITPSTPTRVAPPDASREALAAEITTITVSSDDSKKNDPNSYRYGGRSKDIKYERQPPPNVPLRKEILARTFTLTKAGEAQGWSTSWPSSAGGGLIASGPMGMGMVTILGVDPETIPDTLDASASQRLWRAVLAAPLANYISTPFSNSHPRDEQISSALNSIISVPPLGNIVFIVILVSLGALALLLGPIDWFVLKRFRARQHSWLVALGWISLASVAGFLIPPRLRSGPPQINRLTAIDVLQSSNTPDARAAAWQNGLTGIFASGPLTIAPDKDPQSPIAGSWWHGIAPEDPSSYSPFSRPQNRGLSIFAPLVTPQLTSADRDRQNVPEPFTMPSWSYRTFADSSTPKAPPIRAVVTPSGSGYSVALSGLPTSDRIVSLALRVSSLKPMPPSEVSFIDATGAAISPTASIPEPRDDRIYRYDDFGNQIPRPPADPNAPFWASDIPGPANRAAAISARLDSGRWAMVEIVLSDAIPSARFLTEQALVQEKFETSNLTSIRLLVPIAASTDSPKPQTPSAPPSKEPTP